VIESLLLYLFAAAALAGALIMLVARHPMRVALALIATMLSLAGIYALLGVHVIAVFQVLIYVGAVMVFMVYVIMLLDVRDRSYVHRYSRLLVPAIVGFAALVAVLCYGSWWGLPAVAGVTVDGRYGVQPFSVVFLNEYWLHFELVSVLLVAAVVAAIAVVKVALGNRG
jgi:NADH-quinone oxidoreductase subunit J